MSNRKVRLTKSELDEMILESIKKAYSAKRMNENRQNKIINDVINEELSRLLKENDGDEMKRNSVMKALKDPKYNHAQLAYSLWPDMDKDTARSLFAKMANGTPDNDGAIRHFTDDDVNKLYQTIRANK